jgi:UPF0176 protein
VYQLEDGMHGYMEKYPGKDFLGTLYTFDNRLTMHFGGEREVVGTCRLCGTQTESYTNCANDRCHRHYLLCRECREAGRLACGQECETLVGAQQRSGAVLDTRNAPVL